MVRTPVRSHLAAQAIRIERATTAMLQHTVITKGIIKLSTA
jgi:hypothetical protein